MTHIKRRLLYSPSAALPTPSMRLPVLPALDQVGVFAQHSFQLPLARLLLQIHAVALHTSPAASSSNRAGAGAVRPAPTAGLPGRGAPAVFRRRGVGFVGPEMRTAERLFHPGDGTVESRRRRRRSRKRGEEGMGTDLDQKHQQLSRENFSKACGKRGDASLLS